jgi:tRNA1Val (adenine37-N6)-methyltransferase
MAAVTGCASADGAALTVGLYASHDALFGGRVVLHQPARGHGYRANVDALLLATFASSGKPVRTVFDLGAGVGAVGLALLHLGASERVVMVEIDADAAEMARRNLDANGWTRKSEVLRADVRHVARERAGEAQLVVCNPPYIEPGRGRAAKVLARRAARSGELAAFVEAARGLAGRRARVCFVYPAPELSTLFATLRGAGLEPKRARLVHATKVRPARVVLVEAQPGKAGGLKFEAPLVERSGRGYSREMQRLLARGI